MGELPDNLLKKSELMACLCAPGVVAEALEHLMRGEAARAEFDACVRCDPVLALRLPRPSERLGGALARAWAHCVTPSPRLPA